MITKRDILDMPQEIDSQGNIRFYSHCIDCYPKCCTPGCNNEAQYIIVDISTGGPSFLHLSCNSCLAFDWKRSSPIFVPLASPKEEIMQILKAAKLVSAAMA